MASVRVDDIAINVECSGPPAAPVLMLSNSLGTDLSLWDAQIDDLAQHHFVVRYDSRGHGATEAPGGDYSIARLGQDALGVMDALGIERFSFCGLSLGGMTGQWLGANAGRRLERLVLCSTAPVMGDAAFWNERIAAVRAHGMDSIVEAILERWFTPPFRSSHPAAVARIAAMLRATPVSGYAGSCAAVRDMDQRATLPRITTPTLTIAGTSDPGTPPATLKAIADAIPDATSVELPGAHLINVESARDFNTALLRFLNA